MAPRSHCYSSRFFFLVRHLPCLSHSASIQLVPGKPGPRTPQSTSHPAASSAAIPSCCWPLAPLPIPLAPRFLLLACSPQCSLTTEPTSCGYDYHFPSIPLRANGHNSCYQTLTFVALPVSAKRTPILQPSTSLLGRLPGHAKRSFYAPFALLAHSRRKHAAIMDHTLYSAPTS